MDRGILAEHGAPTVAARSVGLKRVYEPRTEADGYRVPVERLWPRVVSRERAGVDLWLNDAGASPELRVWYGHDPGKWEEFRRRYFVEIRNRPAVLGSLHRLLDREKRVTFLYSTRDEEHNNALALKEFLMKNGT